MNVSNCRCPPGMIGDPYSFCRPEPEVECREDPDCRHNFACLNGVCRDPCVAIQPCDPSATCRALPTVPLRTMICVCPDGHITTPGGTCGKIPVISDLCLSDDDCPDDKACVNSVCRDPCDCGPNSACRVVDHKPVCSCVDGFAGTPELGCFTVGCETNANCPGTHACKNNICAEICSLHNPCAAFAECRPFEHNPICTCPPGTTGNPGVACSPIGCQQDGDCPSEKSCENGRCVDPCEFADPCAQDAECKVINNQVACQCPPGYEGDPVVGCTPSKFTNESTYC
jgi:hypothetical protein